MIDMQRVEELLIEWETGWREGQPPDPASLCPETSDDQTELKRRIDLLKRFEVFQDDATEEPQILLKAAEAPKIPGYSIRRKLGSGGMGEVYGAWQEALGREVALKVVKGGIHTSAQANKRFVREAQILAQMKHRNLVPIFDANLHLGTPYFVMELVQGGNLAELLPHFYEHISKAVQLVADVAAVVHYAHQKGVLHRDLKPANILLDEHFQPRVCDFGIAKLFDDEPESFSDSGIGDGSAVGSLSETSATLGTPPYMAPEQFRTRLGDLSPRTDVWALGVILYELLTGKRPFAADGQNSLVQSVCESAPIRPGLIRPKIDWRLERIVLKCLEKNPAQRYQSAEAVAAELGAWRAGKIPQACQASWIRRVTYRVGYRSLLLGTIALAAIAIFLTRGLNTRTDPDQPLKEIETRLAHGEKVELIGASGSPAWFRMRTDNGKTLSSLAADGTFSVHSWGLSLVELVHYPPLARYRIRAEVRHDKSEGQGEVGIYFGHFGYALEGTEVHTYFSIVFNDIIDEVVVHRRLAPNNLGLREPVGNPVRLSANVFATQKDMVLAESSLLPINPEMFRATGFKGPCPWRSLVIDVTPETIRGYWDETRVVGDFKIAEVLKTLDAELLRLNLRHADSPTMVQMNPGFPGGALGLFISKSSVSFRSVSIEPLPQ